MGPFFNNLKKQPFKWGYGDLGVNKKRFIEQAAGDDVVIYDLVEEQYHSLSAEASFVLSRLRDGMNAEEICSLFEESFPQHADASTEMVKQVENALRERGLWGAQSKSDSLKMDRRQVLKVGGVTLLATVLASAPAAAFSGPLAVTRAVWMSDPGGIYSPGTTDARCPPPQGRATGFTDVTAEVIALGSTDGNGTSTLTIPNTFTTSANLGSDPSGVTANELRVTYTCSGVTQPFAFVCEGAGTVITCP